MEPNAKNEVGLADLRSVAKALRDLAQICDECGDMLEAAKRHKVQTKNWKNGKNGLKYIHSFIVDLPGAIRSMGVSDSIGHLMVAEKTKAHRTATASSKRVRKKTRDDEG